MYYGYREIKQVERGAWPCREEDFALSSLGQPIPYEIWLECRKPVVDDYAWPSSAVGSKSDSPLRSSVVRLTHVVLSDAELLAAVQSVSTEEYIQVHDFTSVLDKRETPQTIGFFVQLAGPLGPRAHMTTRRLFQVLGAANDEYRQPPQSGETCVPTVRIVKPGTFMEYRRWKGEKMKIGLGQVKVPVVLSSAEAHEWRLERVTQELTHDTL